MNDWPVRRFIILVLSLQLSLSGLVALSAFNIEVPIIRQVIGFIFLTFVPGFVILRILKCHNLGTIKSLLFSAGLSIAFLMMVFFSINILLPFIGITNPISTFSLMVTLNIVIFILLIICYLRDNGFTSLNSKIDLSKYGNPYVLSLFLLPFLTVLGTYFVNFHNNNYLLFGLLAVIAALPLITIKSKKISDEMYPLSLIVISVSLLLHNSLISPYIQGRDIHAEYYFANLVLENSVWDPALSNPGNALLSIVGLAPTYSKTLGIELTWIFKIVYPLLFSLVPLSLYFTFRKQTNVKIGYLSSSMFIFMFPFYFDMLTMVRQQMAMLFLALLLILLYDSDKNLKRVSRTILIMSFAIALIVSHYATSYLFGFLLVSSLFVTYLLNMLKQRHSRNLYSGENKISYNFVIFYMVAALSWYIYTAESSFFINFVNLSNHIINSILTDFFQPESSVAFSTLTSGSKSPLYQVTKYMHILIQVFITLGLLSTLIKILSGKNIRSFSEEIAISLTVFLFLGTTLVIPYFGLETPRFYYLSLFFLAPFCPIGLEEMYRVMKKNLLRTTHGKNEIKGVTTLFAVFLIPFLLFNSGFVYELARSYPNSPSLSKNSIHNQSLQEKYNFYNFYTTHEQDVFCSRWLARNTDFSNIVVYSSGLSTFTLTSYAMGGVEMSTWTGDTNRSRQLTQYTDKFEDGSYIFITYVNTQENLMCERRYGQPVKLYKYSDFKSKLANKCKVYDNGASMVYYNKE